MCRKLTISKVWVWLIGIFLIVRIIYSIIGAAVLWDGDPILPNVGNQIYETRSVTVKEGGELARLLINGWYRWDTGWYLKIGAFGYSVEDGSIVFPPLYPILIRLASIIFSSNYLLSALLISNASCLVALILFAKLALENKYSDEEVIWAALFFMTFPAAFFLFAGYTESLFLALMLAAFLFANRSRWGLAGAAVFLAALTRTQGWLLCIPLGWMALAGDCGQGLIDPGIEIKRVYEKISSKKGWRQVLSNLRSGTWLVIALPLIALIGRMAWLEVAGLGSITDAYTKYWNSEIVPPWEGIRLLFTRLVNGQLGFTEWISFILLASFIILAIYGIKHFPIAFTLYVWTNIGLLLMRFHPTQFLVSYIRYLLILFPIFYLLGYLGNRRRPLFFIAIIFLGLQLIFVWLFFQWVWVA